MPRFLALCILAPALAAFGQAAITPAPFHPVNPRDFFDAAAPAYDFNVATLKPWHLKATYEISADSSKGQGTFEHWWVSPEVYRDSWSRSGGVHDEWHTADGKHAYQGKNVLDYFEYALKTSLLRPLPSAAELNTPTTRLDRQSVTIGGVKLPCVMVVPYMAPHGGVQQIPLGLFPTYCFTDTAPILRVEFSWGSLAIEYNKIVKVQDHYIAREVVMFEGKRKILSANVDVIEGISPQDPALVPPPEVPASTTDNVALSSGIATGMLIRKVTPVYPDDAKRARVTGRVALQATIGRDGTVHDLHIIETPWPSLAASALWSVSQWRYKPFLLNGEPVEVHTTINVIYTLDR